MRFWDWIGSWRRTKEAPLSGKHGRLGERAARRLLQRLGLRFLTANYQTQYGEIDLIFRDGDCLVFAEVKTRTGPGWLRPAEAVTLAKQRRLSKAALHYLKRLRDPYVKIRFDIVEVLLEGGRITEIRHLPDAFVLSPPYRYG